MVGLGCPLHSGCNHSGSRRYSRMLLHDCLALRSRRLQMTAEATMVLLRWSWQVGKMRMEGRDGAVLVAAAEVVGSGAGEC